VLGATGNLYVGVNQEYYSAPLNQAIHAEQAAIAMAHVHGETDIVKIMASERPCGHCRQFLNELANASQLQVLLPDGNTMLLPVLLPHAFGPEALGEKGGLLSATELALTCADAQSDVELKALHATNKSYSPYAKSYSGLALKTRDGKIYSGSYLENAVFNPSLPALQAAFVHLVQSGAAFADIQEAVLIQVKGGAVDHAPMTVMLMKVVCPQVKLRVLTAV
jgi:cytidine deaminase